MKETKKSPPIAIFDKKTRNKTLQIALIALSVLVAFGVFWELRLTGITMTDDTVYCGLEEHEHSDDCYEPLLICGLEEEGHLHTEECYEEIATLVCDIEDEDHEHEEDCYELESQLICELEEGQHEHTQDCYEESLSCSLEEHSHDWSCYVDTTADLETKEDWESTLKNISLSGNWNEDLIKIAESQLGYRESERNYQLDEETDTRRGYSRYGQWYGDNYADWEAIFVSFALNYAEIPEVYVPRAKNAQSFMEALERENIFFLEDYEGEPGDLVLFDRRDEETKLEEGNRVRASHIAILTEIDLNNKLITVIEGNHEDAVAKVIYKLEDETILGYGSLETAQARLEEEPRAILSQLTDEEAIVLEVDLNIEGNYSFSFEYMNADEEIDYENEWEVLATTEEPKLLLDDELLELLEAGTTLRASVLEDEDLLLISNEINLELDLASEELILTATTKDGVEVTMRGPSSSFPTPRSELELSVEELLEDEEDSLYEEALEILTEELKKEEKQVRSNRLFDIQLLQNGEEVQPTGPIKISFKGLTQDEDKEVQVYHINDDEKTIEDMKTETSEEGEVIFDTDHLSIFATSFGDISIFAIGDGVTSHDTRSEGIIINLFDYWVNTNDPANESENSNGGINNGKNLKFRQDSDSSLGPMNHYNGGGPVAVQGIVRNNLNSNGYPVIRSQYLTDNDFQDSDYLFDPTLSQSGKASYPNVNYLFVKTEDGFYEYNSNLHYAYYTGGNQGNGNFELRETYTVYDRNTNMENERPVGFFPLSVFDSNKVFVDPDIYYNHYLGLTMEASFYMPPDGIINDNEMIFKFEGDDDIWVFVDDVLVLDMGGVHQAVKGTINFATGDVIINDPNIGNTTITERFGAAQESWDDSSYKEHTIKLFWLERGNWDSNFHARFNLPLKRDLEITKQVTDAENDIENSENKDYEFQLYISENGSSNPVLYTGPAFYKDTDNQVVFDTDGTFKLKEGETVEVRNLMGNRKYFLKEVNINENEFGLVTFNGKVLEKENENGGLYSVSSPESRIDDNFTVVMNNITPESLTNFKVVKHWSDGNEAHSGDQIEFKLLYEETNEVSYPVNGVLTKTFTLYSGNNWEMSFEDLPMGEYVVEEIEPPSDYVVSYDKYKDKDGNYVYVIRNSKKADSGSIIVEKRWYNSNGDLLPEAPEESVLINLYEEKTSNLGYRTVTFVNRYGPSNFGEPKVVPIGSDIYFAALQVRGYEQTYYPFEYYRLKRGNNQGVRISPSGPSISRQNNSHLASGRIYGRDWSYYTDLYKISNITNDITVTLEYDSDMHSLTQYFYFDYVVSNQGNGDGEATTTESYEIYLNKENNWSYNHPAKEDTSSATYKYYVEEVTVNGIPIEDTIYTSEIIENNVSAGNNIIIKNTSTLNFGYELPKTGGPGTPRYVISGLLIMLAALLYGYRRHRRERGLIT